MKISILFVFCVFISLILVYPQTKCRTQGKWALISVPKAQLMKVLPKGVYFDRHPFQMPIENHPVYLEFNYQHQCWTFYIIPSPNMLEFKIQIPFLMTEKINNIIHKPLVLADKWLNVMGAKYFYGLDAFVADFQGDYVNNVNIFNEKEEISIKANFSYKGDYITNYNKTVYFESTFMSINKNPWITDGKNFDSNNPYCAFNAYSWEKNVKFRYMEANIEIQWGNIFEGRYKVYPLEKEFMGGIEVDVDLTISPRSYCIKKKIEL